MNVNLVENLTKKFLDNKTFFTNLLILEVVTHIFYKVSFENFLLRDFEINKVVFMIKSINQDIINIVNTQFGIDFNVPLLLESKIGDNWLDTKDIA